ncbi:MAG TPA: trypsin-like peptidase domain-containing protein [Elusimicrobiales bacterium]|nr:trypsin-like peptidase domain-containing protein [Elusimicrobiales bacterium]
MKRILLISILFLISASGADAQNEALKVQQTLNAIAAKAKPAVVSLKVVREESETFLEPEFFFGYYVPRERTYRYDVQGMGSGFFIDPEGHILTNYHVVEGATRIKVSVANPGGKEKTYMARLSGGDPALDLAVLKITSSDRFPWLELERAGTAKVGDFALAVGYPFGFKQTFTSGIVSALNADIKVEGRKYDSLIQTDAAINQGNSGGPLLNLDGRVIGINTAIISPSGAFAGLGFAIPSDEVARVLPDLMAGRRVKRGWIGVSLSALDPVMAARMGLKTDSGAVVNAVAKGSPAYAAGISRGDIITACDGGPVETETDLFYRTYTRRPGEQIELSLVSRGKEKTVKLTLAERPERDASVVYGSGRNAAPGPVRTGRGTFAWEGAALRYDDGGAVVEHVGSDSRLFGYLRRGDIVRSVNRKPVSSAAAMPQVFRSADLGEGVLFDIERDGEAMYVSVQTK